MGGIKEEIRVRTEANAELAKRKARWAKDVTLREAEGGGEDECVDADGEA